MKQLIFLIYPSRSGSTLLSKLLSEFEQVGVTVEAILPDGLCKKKININSLKDIEPALDLIYSDEKFRNWKISRTELRSFFENSPYPVMFNNLLTTVLQMYFKDTQKNIYVYK
ncbi:MAG: hypothetical protein P9M03_11875, partial [Candidatus Theseobacter exili]|nr:hypothetical protein [Candidatus Theseobacter exili]